MQNIRKSLSDAIMAEPLSDPEMWEDWEERDSRVRKAAFDRSNAARKYNPDGNDMDDVDGADQFADSIMALSELQASFGPLDDIACACGCGKLVLMSLSVSHVWYIDDGKKFRPDAGQAFFAGHDSWLLRTIRLGVRTGSDKCVELLQHFGWGKHLTTYDLMFHAINSGQGPSLRDKAKQYITNNDVKRQIMKMEGDVMPEANAKINFKEVNMRVRPRAIVEGPDDGQ